jgi:hypothetical protein
MNSSAARHPLCHPRPNKCSARMAAWPSHLMRLITGWFEHEVLSWAMWLPG